MTTKVNCDVCGFPLLGGECMHTALGVSPQEWRRRVAPAIEAKVNVKMACLGCLFDKAEAEYHTIFCEARK